MVDLDDLSIYPRLDRGNMLRHLEELPQECLKAWERGSAFELPLEYGKVKQMVVLGMGGSAMGGNLIQNISSLEGGIPIFVCRGIDPPEFINEDTLVVVVSYSGNTLETLTSLSKLKGKRARKLALTSGGRLKDIALRDGIPLFLVDYVSPPRAALAHIFLSLLGILGKLKLIPDKSEEVRRVADLLTILKEEFSPQKEEAKPKEVAAKLRGRMVLIYAEEAVSAVGYRWKTQLNENSKTFAIAEFIPELCHNSVEGYKFPPNMEEKIYAILLSPTQDENLPWFKVVADVLRQRGIGFVEVAPFGESLLEKMMSLIYFGDYVSYYLSLLNHTDPSPVDTIGYIKRRLEDDRPKRA
jgi:glucose/mannose-6-phosphate isomerase